MFRIRAYSTDTCLACFDLAVVGCCYVAVMLFGLRPAETSWRLLARDHLVGLGLVWVIWFGLSVYFGLYTSRRLASPLADLGILVKTALTSWVLLEGVAHKVAWLSPTSFF